VDRSKGKLDMSMSQDHNDRHMFAKFSDEDRRLLALLDDLPLVARPWQLVAAEAGCSQRQLLSKLGHWLRCGYVQRIAGLFNSGKLGYRSTLAAVNVGPDEADRAAQTISAYQAVSHNFLREGAELNLWFTVTCPGKGQRLEHVLDDIAHKVSKPVRRFDTIKRYKISFRSVFHRTVRPAWAEQPVPANQPGEDLLVRVIDLVQQDFPLTDRPFDELADRAGLDGRDVLEAASFLKYQKIIRRIGAMVDLAKSTTTKTVMCAWAGDENELELLAHAASSHQLISHCYGRTAYHDWPWKIYTVIHGYDRRQCVRVIEELAAPFFNVRYLTLWTVKQYKQSPIQYEPDKIVLAI